MDLNCYETFDEAHIIPGQAEQHQLSDYFEWPEHFHYSVSELFNDDNVLIDDKQMEGSK